MLTDEVRSARVRAAEDAVLFRIQAPTSETAPGQPSLAAYFDKFLQQRWLLNFSA